MARPHIQFEDPAYYPRRAHWRSPFLRAGQVLRRRMALDRLCLPAGMRIGEIVAGFFVPGLAVWLREPRIWGPSALAGSAALMAVFVVWLGYPVANLAFGLLISLHATGFAYYCSPLMASEPFRRRLVFTLLVLLGLGLVIYMPLRNLIQERWFTPLRLNGRVVVVQRTPQARQIHRGDWVAYAMHENYTGEAHNGGAVWVQAGMSLGSVLAVAGDEVRFSINTFSVNGVLHTNLAYMPRTGDFTVPENHWFIWPNLDISGHGNVTGASLGSTMLSLADVNQNQYFGKPLHRWFGRKQILP